MFDTFDAVRRHAIGALLRAATDRRSPMHTPVVVTANGGARIMVLRAFDAEHWTLRFHTDARAGKVAAIAAAPRTTVLAYDPEEKLQLRLYGSAQVIASGPEADDAWTASSRFARRCYLGEAPGTGAAAPSSGLPAWAEGIQPSEEQLAPARANFAVLVFTADEIDWYWLSNTGHRRAAVKRDGGRWLTP